ncbi:MAG TPA: 6-carboxytetrahydropterin synthase QueD [Myxococcota bacterium]|nr:6-carboxytetrahydropterin synthase QueD [Myxococcota bacterium]
MEIVLTRSFRLESARRLPRLPATHPCARVHGHSFVIEVELAGAVDPELGWLIDYNDIAAAFEPLRQALDHHLLNEVEGLENPTSEHIARWVFERLARTLPALTAVTVMETPETRAIYRPRRGTP